MIINMHHARAVTVEYPGYLKIEHASGHVILVGADGIDVYRDAAREQSGHDPDTGRALVGDCATPLATYGVEIAMTECVGEAGVSYGDGSDVPPDTWAIDVIETTSSVVVAVAEDHVSVWPDRELFDCARAEEATVVDLPTVADTMADDLMAEADAEESATPTITIEVVVPAGRSVGLVLDADGDPLTFRTVEA